MRHGEAAVGRDIVASSGGAVGRGKGRVPLLRLRVLALDRRPARARPRLHQRQQVVEHQGLDLELDAVDHGLVRRLDLKIVRVLGDHERHVEGDDNHKQRHELAVDGPDPRALDHVHELEALRRLVHVEPGDNRLLQRKGRDLDLFVDVEDAPRQLARRDIRVGRDEEQRRRDLHEQEHGDDHEQDPTDLARVAHDEV